MSQGMSRIGLDIAAMSPVAWAGLGAFMAGLVMLWWAMRAEAEGQIGRVEMERKRRDGRRAMNSQNGQNGQRVRGKGLRGKRLQRAILAGDVVGSLATMEAAAQARHPYDAPALPAPVYFPYGSWQPPARAGTVDPLVVRVAGRTPPSLPSALLSAPAPAPAPAREPETYCPACLCVALERHDAPAGDRMARVGDVASAYMLSGWALGLLCRHHDRALLALGEEHRLRTIGGLMRYARRVLDRYRDGYRDRYRDGYRAGWDEEGDESNEGDEDHEDEYEGDHGGGGRVA